MRKQEREGELIVDGKWKTKSNLSRIRGMKEWRVKSLRLQNNKRSELVKDIAHVVFPNLMYLGVWGNQVDCIQVMGKIDMPNIQTLHLNQNHITSIKAMRKAHWALLQVLHLNNNYICDLQVLTQGFLPSLERLWLFDNFSFKDNNKYGDRCFAVKLETQFLKRLSISLSTSEYLFKAVLKRKWELSVI